MCLQGPTLSVTQHAKRVKFGQIAEGVQPRNSVLAWRVWNIGDLFPSVTLKSENRPVIWVPGKSLDGKVEEKGKEGVHAYKSVKEMVSGGYTDMARSDYKQEKKIVGLVLLWGKIAEHKNGYRAEHAYPWLIYANGPELQVRIAAHYGCQASRTFIPRLLAEAA